MYAKLRLFVSAHKIISVLAVIVIVGGGYYWYSSTRTTTTVTKYVVQNATLGTVVSSVSGSGQVSAVTTLDVKPQVTETVTKVLVKVGDQVKAGQVLVQLDPTNEEKALQQAQLSLQSSQLSLAKLQEPPATTTLMQDENAVTQDQEQLVTASTTLARDYQSGFDSVASAFVDFQTVMSSLQDFTLGTELSKGQQNPDVLVTLMPNYLQASTSIYRDTVVADYNASAAAYQQNLLDYHAASRSSPPVTLDELFTESENTAQLLAENVKDIKSMLDFITSNYPKNIGLAPLPSLVTTFQTNFGNYTGTVNGDITNLANAANNIASDKTAITNDNFSLTQAQGSLAELQAGPDPLDIQSQQLSLEQQQFSIQTAQQNLADTSIRAPIDGTISAVDAIVGEDVPSPAVSMVGSGEEAELTLNEIDATKVAVGDKATLTFDALPDLSLAGQVIQLSPVGTVSQGVVNYSVYIGFSQPADTSSTDLVRPGMSVTADIVTQVDQNVVALPNAAIQTQGTASYVLEPATPLSAADVAASATGGVLISATTRVPVTLGLANDTLTEITSGINAGDQVIVQTIKSSSAAAAPATTGRTTTGLGGLLGGGGGAVGGATFRAGAAGGGGFGGGAGAAR